MKARRAERPQASTSDLPCPDDLRTFAIVGHRSSGKTSLAELLLQAARVTREVGEVERGTALLDWTHGERRHHQTLEVGAAWFDWDGRSVQLLDTPGAEFLSGLRDPALAATEAALVVVDAQAGVQVGTEDALRAASRLTLPVLAVISKADRLDRDFDALVDALATASGLRAAPLHLPLRDEAGQLVGLVDVLERVAWRYADDGSGAASPEPVPEEMRGAVAAAVEALTEAVALTDDTLLEQYLELLELPADRVRDALPDAVRTRALLPVLIAAPARRIGAAPVLDALARLVPPPSRRAPRVRDEDGAIRDLPLDGPFVAQVISTHRDQDGEPWSLLRVVSGSPPRGDWRVARTGETARVRKLYRVRGPRRSVAAAVGPGMIVGVWDPLPVRPGDTLTDGERVTIVGPEPEPPMMSWALRGRTPRDSARLPEALQVVLSADPGLSVHADDTTGDLVLSGAEEGHLRLAVERLADWTGVEVTTGLPAVGYREIPTAPVSRVEGIHVREGTDGLVAEYGRCEVALEPDDPAVGASFLDALGDEEDDLPRKYRPAIDQGLREALRHGPTAGYPVVGARIRLTGGDYDILQSTDDHFRLAGQKAARVALERSGTRLLEPWWEIRVRAPQDALGDLISDISAHRGRILGMEVEGTEARVVAQYPYRELRTFASRLQGLTGGRGRFRSTSTHYEPLPSHLVREAIEASPHRGGPGSDGRGRPC